MKTAIVVLSFLFVLSAGAAIGLASTGKVDDLVTVTYQTALQLAVIAIAGHVISLLVSSANHQREELKAQDKFRRDVMTKLTEAFFDVKRARRLARANNTPAEGGYPQSITLASYNETMEALNDIQLRIEGVAHDIRSSRALFEHDPKLTSKVDALERYLNEGVDEFESVAIDATGTPLCFPVATLPLFADFVGPYKPSKFRERFIENYYKAVTSMRKALLYAS